MSHDTTEHIEQPPASQGARKPGRSFEDPEKPLGAELLERSGPSREIPEDLRDRVAQAAATSNGVAERAKAIGVLRKLEEIIAYATEPVDAKDPIDAALHVAARSVGLTYDEYRALVDKDPELVALEVRVVESTKMRLAHTPAKDPV